MALLLELRDISQDKKRGNFMIIKPKEYIVKNFNYIIRSAVEEDAKELSAVRVEKRRTWTAKQAKHT